MDATGDTHWCDKRKYRATADVHHFHKKFLSGFQTFFVVFGYYKNALAEFHLYKMNDFVCSADNQVNLSTSPAVTL